ncbi:AAA family ATPase [Pseudoscardovia suis]|uniref:AAA family ATPase n=1 Tax=Pseudoscardovia suis TaxID=987063 RepID=UPI003F9BEBD8
MRIQALAIKGIGPYKDEFFIDFGKLSRNGLFLIDGDTGAGKSTIIDAICFALFSTITRNDGSAGKERMRSRFLPLGANKEASCVELIFSENGKTYYIKRNPGYSHPKRGHLDDPQSAWVQVTEAVTVKRLDSDGYKAAQEKAEHAPDVRGAGKVLIGFARDDEGATVVANGSRQANSAIQEIVGLNASQFRTVICLPQGQFESFLHAKPEERSGMLIDIFRLGIYDNIQGALHEMEKEKDTDIAHSSALLHGKVSELQGALPDLPFEEDEPDRDAVDGAETASAIAATTEEHADGAGAADDHDDASGFNDAASSDDITSADLDDLDDAADADDDDTHESSISLGERLERWNSQSINGSQADQLVELPIDNIADKRNGLDAILDRIDIELSAVVMQGADVREAAQHRRDEAQADLTLVGKLTEDLRKQQGLVERQAALMADEDRISKIRTSVEKARNAIPVSDANDAVKDAETAVADREQALKDATDKLAAMESKETLIERQSEAQKAQIAVTKERAERDRCTADLDQLNQLDRAQKELADLQDGVASAKKTLDEAEAKLASCGDPEKINANYESAKDVVATKPVVKSALDATAKTLADFETLDRLLKERTELESVEKETKATHDAAQERNEQVKLEQRIAELGIALEDGKPCPVCGSTMHPHVIAASDADEVDDADEADRKFKEAKAAWEDAKSKLNQCQGKISSLTENLKGVTPDEAQTNHGIAVKNLKAVEKVEEELQSLKAASDALVIAQKARDKAANDLRVQQGKATTKQEDVDKRREACVGKDIDALSARIADLNEQIESNDKIASGLNAIADKIAKRNEAEKTQRSCSDVLAQKKKDLEAARDKLARVISERGFASLDVALAAILDAKDLDHLDGQVRQYEQDVRSTDDQLKAALDDLHGHLTEDSNRTLRLLNIDVLPEYIDLWKVKEPGAVSLGTAAPDTAALDNAVLDTAASGNAAPDAAGFGIAGLGAADTDTGLSDGDKSTELASGESAPVMLTHLGALIDAVDEKALRECFDDASHTYDDANSKYESAKSSYEGFGTKRKAIDKAADEWEKTRSQAWPYQCMSQLLCGKNYRGENPNRLTISAYAVQQIFTAVLDETNIILKGIHDGIFRLSLGNKSKGGAKQGLPISVYDARTNRNSDVETLSGGETFFISLALSLGLARVVQTRAAGIEMGVFFIDEGFGTLDENCRADVVLELQKLAEQGRSIGVISHVSQLQEAIGTQIKVMRGKSAGGKDGDGPSMIDFQVA